MADQPSSLSGSFGRPFTEQIAFFRNKLGNLVPTEFWDDLEREQHDTGFMVAGAQKADLLSDLAAAVDRSISEGKSLDAFRKDFKAIVQRHGWTGWTGEGTKAGEAWRTRTIYRTNAATSYAAGRYAQLVEANYPLWVYFHGGSKEPRPEHLAFDGLCLPPDHPFWKIFYPPSDWGCSCYVIGARSERAARRLGADPDKKLPDGWDQIDPKTGVTKGAGRGWDYAPGASVAPIVQAAAEKISSWDYRIAKGFMDGVPDAMRDALAESYRALPSVADDARRAAQRIWDGRARPEPGRTLGMIKGEQAEAVREALDVDASLFDFSLSPDEIQHVKNRHGVEEDAWQRDVTPEDFARLPQIVQNGSKMRMVGRSDSRRLPVFEIVLEIDGETYVTRWEYWAKRRTFTLLSFFVRK